MCEGRLMTDSILRLRDCGGQRVVVGVIACVHEDGTTHPLAHPPIDFSYHQRDKQRVLPFEPHYRPDFSPLDQIREYAPELLADRA